MIEFEWYEAGDLSYFEFKATLDGVPLLKWRIVNKVSSDTRGDLWAQFCRDAWGMVASA